MNILISPSILSADLAHLQEEVGSIEPYADWLQVDVMDGHFVPNLSFGAPVLKSLHTNLPLDIHLMVENPADRIEEFLKLKVHNISFHAETVKDTDSRLALIQAIHEGGATCGIAINPSTLVSEIDDVISEVDVVLVMSVNPGFGGQDFIAGSIDKIRELRLKHKDLMIQVDGGINTDTAYLCREAGANNLVAGSFIFKASDREAAIRSLRGQ
jgi:ribulose-phosphate 3-epimerase